MASEPGYYAEYPFCGNATSGEVLGEWSNRSGASATSDDGETWADDGVHKHNVMTNTGLDGDDDGM